MFKNTSFEALAKTMSESQFDASAVQDNLKAWADLANSQAKEAQGVLTQAVESMKAAQDPHAAFEAVRSSAEASIAMFARNLKQAASLGVGQFHGTVDAMEKVHPAPENFAPVAKGLKAAASAVESTLDAAMEKSAAMAASATPKARKSGG